MNLLDEFKELTKYDEYNIKAYEQPKDAKIKKQQELLTAQDVERERIMQGNQRPRNTHYEELWASMEPGHIMPKEGRGKYNRANFIGKTCNSDESRHMAAESKRLRYRGKQYLSLAKYKNNASEDGNNVYKF